MRCGVFLKKETLPSERGIHSGKLKEFYSSLKNGSHNRPFLKSTIKAEHSIQLTLSVSTGVIQLTLSVSTGVEASHKTCICFICFVSLSESSFLPQHLPIHERICQRMGFPSGSTVKNPSAMLELRV